MKLAPIALLVLLSAALIGCGSSSSSSEAPPVTAKITSWKDMTKEEKIAQINRSPMPAEAKQKSIAAVQAGTQ